MLLWQRGTLPTRGGPWEEQPGHLVQGLREFYVQLILFTCKIWVSACFLGCLPHRQFAAGLQRQVDGCYRHRFYPNPCQRLPCVRAGLSLTSAAVGRCVWEGVKRSWIKTRPRKPSSLPLAAWDKRCGCLRCASVPVRRQRRLSLWN